MDFASYGLPDFPPLLDAELRQLWFEFGDDGRRLILEVVRGRRVLEAVDDLRAALDRACAAEGGQIAALYRLRILLQSEVSASRRPS